MIVETNRLTKYYGSKVGCRDITLSIKEGEIFGLLGPNGAGKSTFVKLLTSLIFPSGGSAWVLGKPLGDVASRKKIGYLPENFKYQDWMTGVELLSFHASLCKMEKAEAVRRISDVLELVGLKEHSGYRVGTYSKGMQQRIGIACALLSDPDLLFLDEPTSALDPIGRKEIRDLLAVLKMQGKTVLLNSHLLSEIEMVCDSIAIINKGSIIRSGKLDEFLEEKLTLEIHADGINEEAKSCLGKIDPNAIIVNDRINMKIRSRDDIHAIASMIIEKGGRLYGLVPVRENLESIFISLIGGEDKCLQ